MGDEIDEPALGRPAHIGSFYNMRTHQVLSYQVLKESGKMIKRMEKEPFFGPTVVDMKESEKMIK
jgi:hypothetical protein